MMFARYPFRYAPGTLSDRMGGRRRGHRSRQAGFALVLGWLLAAGIGSSAVAATLYQGGKAMALRQDANHVLVE
ncbi:MAG TPA: hypothetical protein PLC79_07300, partial [Phycisphaerae bacterium]|nr:hypothetical protein [Phycisphaerae bacterium]